MWNKVYSLCLVGAAVMMTCASNSLHSWVFGKQRWCIFINKTMLGKLPADLWPLSDHFQLSCITSVEYFRESSKGEFIVLFVSLHYKAVGLHRVPLVLRFYCVFNHLFCRFCTPPSTHKLIFMPAFLLLSLNLTFYFISAELWLFFYNLLEQRWD